MIVSAHQHQDELRPLSHDGSNGMPYVAHLPKNTDLYLVMPFRQWNENELPEFWQFPRLCHSNLFFQALFSVRSNWALGCTARNRCSDGKNALQHSRDCSVGQIA